MDVLLLILEALEAIYWAVHGLYEKLSSPDGSDDVDEPDE